MKLTYRLISLYFSKEMKAEFHRVLSAWSSYYKHLGKRQQREFLVRTLRFHYTTAFNSTPDFEVTQEMMIVISSAFVQITFGLSADTLSMFRKIFIAPTSYSYKGTKLLFDGDVNIATRQVNLSWPAVEQGFVVTDNGVNLAIHEFGHCLIIEQMHPRSRVTFFSERKLNVWRDLAMNQLPLIRSGHTTLFRGYGGFNLMELFSVSMESFFEQPDEFYSASPVFYRSMADLLKQDPRQRSNPRKHWKLSA
ncbi:zinc-dependent peptidase [Croceiramulus getboli]|nr:zinc-dependent peptidase [Flavobacteriaceae bacterium YJPT1-3]